jgi:hypothetical protein
MKQIVKDKKENKRINKRTNRKSCTNKFLGENEDWLLDYERMILLNKEIGYDAENKDGILNKATEEIYICYVKWVNKYKELYQKLTGKKVILPKK